MRIRLVASAFSLGLALAGCASQPKRVAIAAPVAPPAPVAAAPLPMPRPPAGAAASLTMPPITSDGQYLTPNRGISAAEAVWHVRAALNVAALGCGGAEDAQRIAAYNLLLSQQKTALAFADTAVKKEYRERFGAGWQDAHDNQMTRVYNFFAQPPGQSGFCAVATALLTQATTVAPGGFEAFATAALPQLETPFTDFYRAYGAYRSELAAWQAQRTALALLGPVAAPPTMLAPAVRPLAPAATIPTPVAVASSAASFVLAPAVAPATTSVVPAAPPALGYGDVTALVQ